MPGVQGRDLSVDGVEHVSGRVASAGVARRVERVQRTVHRELSVHHVARQAEHHGPARMGVEAGEDHRVGAHTVPVHVAVAAEEQEVHPVAPRPRVHLRHPGRCGRAAVALEDRLDEVRLDPGIADAQDEWRGQDQAEHQDERSAGEGLQPGPVPWTHQGVRRDDHDEPEAQHTGEKTRGELQHVRVEGEVRRGLEVPADVPATGSDEGERGQQDQQARGEASGPQVARSRQHRPQEGDPDGARQAGRAAVLGRRAPSRSRSRGSALGLGRDGAGHVPSRAESKPGGGPGGR